MGTSRSSYVIVGLFVLLMLAGLLYSLVRISGWTAETNAYWTAFANVTGVKDGAKVFYEGFPIGRVVKVSPVPAADAAAIETVRRQRLARLCLEPPCPPEAQAGEGAGAEGGETPPAATPAAARTLFRLDLEVDSTWTIPDNAVATIAAPGFLSAVIVSLREYPVRPGTGATEAAPAPAAAPVAGDLTTERFVASREEESFGDVVRTAATKLAATADTVKTLTFTAQDILVQEVRPTFAEVREMVEEIRPEIPRLVARANTVAAELESFATELRGYTTTENRQQVERLLEQANEAAAQVQVVIGKLGRLSDAANALVAENRQNVDQAIASFRYTMDAIARDIDGINRNIEGTTRNMYEFSRQIRQNPGVLLGGTTPRRTNSQGR